MARLRAPLLHVLLRARAVHRALHRAIDGARGRGLWFLHALFTFRLIARLVVVLLRRAHRPIRRSISRSIDRTHGAVVANCGGLLPTLI